MKVCVSTKDRRNVVKEREKKVRFYDDMHGETGGCSLKMLNRKKKGKNINRPSRGGQYYDDSGKKMSMRKIKTSEGNVWCS